jgi:hypothetical protein
MKGEGGAGSLVDWCNGQMAGYDLAVSRPPALHSQPFSLLLLSSGADDLVGG